LSAIQIPNLPVAIALNGGELLEAVQAGVSVRITTAQLGVLLNAMATTTILGQYNISLPSYSDGGSSTIQTDVNGRLLIVGGGTAGSPSGGILTSQGLAYTSSSTFTRPNNTTAYGAGDVVGSLVAAMTFATIGPSGGGGVLITKAELQIDTASLPAGISNFALQLYSVTPPSALADAAAWDLPSGDRASYLGSIPLGTPVDLGSTLYVKTTGIDEQYRIPSGGALFGYLVTSAAFTPEAETVFTIKLSSIGV
jgi:hypothetical protein